MIISSMNKESFYFPFQPRCLFFLSFFIALLDWLKLSVQCWEVTNMYLYISLTTKMISWQALGKASGSEWWVRISPKLKDVMTLVRTSFYWQKRQPNKARKINQDKLFNNKSDNSSKRSLNIYRRIDMGWACGKLLCINSFDSSILCPFYR